MQRTVAAESVFSSKARKFLPVLPKLQISAHNGGGIHRFSDPLQYLHAVNAVGLKVDIFSYANHAVAANPLCISVSKSLSLPIKTSTFSSCLLTTSKARCAMAVSTVSFSVMESFLCVQQGEKFGQKHMEFARKKQTPSENNFRRRFCMPTCHGLGIVSII